jgi:hypothetical protein
MTREFQVLYRELKAEAVGQILSVNVICESEGQARVQFESAGLQVVAVNFIRALVDWSLPNLDRDEAAEYLRMKSDSLSAIKGTGPVPHSFIGRGIYPRAWLDEMVNANGNAAGKKIAEKLKELETT